MLSFRNIREVALVLCTFLFCMSVYSLGVTGFHLGTVVCVSVWVIGEFITNRVYVYHPVDVWGLQHQLMQASDQKLPAMPMITRGSLTYYALTMEELAETGLALSSWTSTDLEANTGPYPYHPALALALHHVTESQARMKEASVALRQALTMVPPYWSRAVSRAEAKELLDGVCDVTVTIAGLALSSGLPAAAGYEAVQLSNLSKRNPVTGQIDLDPTGKWIKGADYKPPNLEHVLENQWQLTKS